MSLLRAATTDGCAMSRLPPRSEPESETNANREEQTSPNKPPVSSMTPAKRKTTIYKETFSRLLPTSFLGRMANVLGFLMTVVGLTWAIWTGLMTTMDIRWSEQNDVLQTCAALFSINRYSGYCNDTLARAVEPPAIQQDGALLWSNGGPGWSTILAFVLVGIVGLAVCGAILGIVYRDGLRKRSSAERDIHPQPSNRGGRFHRRICSSSALEHAAPSDEAATPDDLFVNSASTGGVHNSPTNSAATMAEAAARLPDVYISGNASHVAHEGELEGSPVPQNPQPTRDRSNAKLPEQARWAPSRLSKGHMRAPSSFRFEAPGDGPIRLLEHATKADTEETLSSELSETDVTPAYPTPPRAAGNAESETVVTERQRRGEKHLALECPLDFSKAWPQDWSLGKSFRSDGPGEAPAVVEEEVQTPTPSSMTATAPESIRERRAHQAAKPAFPNVAYMPVDENTSWREGMPMPWERRPKQPEHEKQE